MACWGFRQPFDSGTIFCVFFLDGNANKTFVRNTAGEQSMPVWQKHAAPTVKATLTVVQIAIILPKEWPIENEMDNPWNGHDMLVNSSGSNGGMCNHQIARLYANHDSVASFDRHKKAPIYKRWKMQAVTCTTCWAPIMPPHFYGAVSIERRTCMEIGPLWSVSREKRPLTDPFNASRRYFPENGQNICRTNKILKKSTCGRV